MPRPEKAPSALWRAILLCGTILFSPPPALAQQPAEEEKAPMSGVLENDLFKARELQGQKKWQELRVHAEEWAYGDPDEWRAWRFLGEAERALGRLPEAVKAFTKAEENRPPVRGSGRVDDALLVAVADLHLADGKELEAENAYLLALRKNDRNTETWRKLTDLRVKMAEGDPLRRRIAADSLERVLRFPRFINDYGRWRKYAELLEALDEHERARGAYVHAVRLEPVDAAAWEKIVLYDLAAGRKESALAGMERLLRADPANVVANAHLGEKALADGFVDKAKERFERVASAQAGDQAARTKAYQHLIALAKTRADRLRLHKAALRVNPALWASWDYVIVDLRGHNQRDAAAELLRQKGLARQLLAEGEPVPDSILP